MSHILTFVRRWRYTLLLVAILAALGTYLALTHKPWWVWLLVAAWLGMCAWQGIQQSSRGR